MLIPSRTAPAVVALLVAGFIVSVSLLGCEGDFRPRAVGVEGQVTVVMDSTSWQGPVGEAFRANVAPYINTLPQPERMFDLRQIDLNSQSTYDRVQEQKNVVFIAPLSDSTNEANFLRDRLSSDVREAVQSGRNIVVPRPNLWRKSQRVFYVTAATPEELISTLENQGQQMRDTFQEITLQRMEREMFEKERQFALEDSLLELHDFMVKVQHDYRIASQDTTGPEGSVWLARILSDTRRDLIVHYVEDASPSLITPEWIVSTRDSLTREYIRGNVAGFARIDKRRELDTKEADFLGRYGYQTEGLWHLVADPDSVDIEGDYSNQEYVEMGGGGPFVNYTFYDQPSGRVYMIDGSVFAPTYDKLQFLRQMEVIARTFKTEREVETAPDGEAPAMITSTP
ncbi:DUF4837 domain-containing protein [Longibacter salinarum]|uniref:DUF4837 domain-containing protein n=1 Tax=Longibacter salinarum TaxID=1850348 RepID=A0A2A8CWX6_9BACT|nr:DUF4837 family protein [Longibacter salinarum]PEN12888.1 DUF4837 domain-containing protein [Longibacter salinarum]